MGRLKTDYWTEQQNLADNYIGDREAEQFDLANALANLKRTIYRIQIYTAGFIAISTTVAFAFGYWLAASEAAQIVVGAK